MTVQQTQKLEGARFWELVTVKSSPLSVRRTGSAGADFTYSRSDSDLKSRGKLPVLRSKLSWTEAHTINRMPGRAGPSTAWAQLTQCVDEQIGAQQGGTLNDLSQQAYDKGHPYSKS